MKNKIFFVALAFVGNLICSDPARRSQLERQLKLEMAQIRASEVVAQASEASAQLSKIITQNEIEEARQQAATQSAEQEAKRIGEQERFRVYSIIQWLLAGRKDCKVTSQIAPYTKSVILEAKATLKELRLTEAGSASLCCTDTEAMPINEERWYRKLYCAPLDELYTKNPEAFNRASAFEGLSFLKPSDISYWVLDLESNYLQPQAREKILNIIHALRPGMIERKGQSLVMLYEGEEVQG